MHQLLNDLLLALAGFQSSNSNFQLTNGKSIAWLDLWNEQIQDLLAAENGHEQHPIPFPAVFIELIGIQWQDAIGYSEGDATIAIHILYQSFAESYILPDAIGTLPKGANDTLTALGGTGAGLLPYLYTDEIIDYFTTNWQGIVTHTSTNTAFYRQKTLHHFVETFALKCYKNTVSTGTIDTFIPDAHVEYDQTLLINLSQQSSGNFNIQ